MVHSLAKNWICLSDRDEQIIKAFGKVLKGLREAKGLSQEALAHAINSHATHISRLENGHKPTLVTLFKIVHELEIDPEKIIIESRNKAKKTWLPRQIYIDHSFCKKPKKMRYLLSNWDKRR